VIGSVERPWALALAAASAALLLALPLVPDLARRQAAAPLVVAVTDGDTIRVLDRTGAAPTEVRVRLHAIDAPEGGQPFWDRAEQALARLVMGREVRLVPRNRDRYGRLVAEVFVGTESVNARMVADGFAWAYVEYGRDFVRQEAEARRQRRGLWADGAPVAPWSWRATH